MRLCLLRVNPSTALRDEEEGQQLPPSSLTDETPVREAKPHQ